MKFLKLATTFLLCISPISQAEELSPIAPVENSMAEEKIASGAQILDVRTQEEWDEGHIKGATRVDVTQNGFLEKAKAVLDPKKEVVVYCRSGRRSAIASEQLRASGFIVHDLAGGFTGWSAAGKEVIKPEAKN